MVCQGETGMQVWHLTMLPCLFIVW
jgi:hypothetical protein